MKTYIPYSLILAAASAGMAFGAETAYTSPVGYYSFAGVKGGNLFVPSLVKPAAYAGGITAASATTLTLPAASLTAGAFNEGAIYATHYVEITSGPNAGVALDIASNTPSLITLADNVSSLGLTGSEKIKIRPHMTLKSSLVAAEASLSAFSDAATFYLADGTNVTYLYGADGGTGWSSDFATANGNLRPIPPGTGFVLGLSATASLALSGEVKTGPTVAMLSGGNVNIVGLVNPLVGSSTPLNATGFGSLAAFSDSITVYVPGALDTSVTYLPLGDGTVSSDFVNPTTNTLSNTTGAVVVPGGDTSVKLNLGFTVAP